MSRKYIGVKKVVIPMMVICVLLLQGVVLEVSASEENATYQAQLGQIDGGVYVDGERLDFGGVDPFIRDGRTLVPIAVIARALGSEVEWNAESRIVGFQKGSDVILQQIGSRNVTVNGQQQQIEVPAEINDNRTYVPLRFVSEQLQARVEWDGETRTINIFTDGEEVDEIPVFDGEELSEEAGRALWEEHIHLFQGRVYKSPNSLEHSKREEVAAFIRENSEYTPIIRQGMIMQMTNGQYVVIGYAQRNNNGVIEQAEATFTAYDGYTIGERHTDLVGVRDNIMTDWQ
ncbi:Copper amine oxidase N-terminal domain-containing protein [Tindallia magadiensis]|uniref:Copper amine oxidase N-terminal domain-containing protein n=1 Tax=Tindallia magadiensis TaxID=69895 RepID=A0A1I3HLE2_9FIRM|nr:stalk domain-containing protein [Tindallia magadiensis]SFI36565.1 Copper amine oxidase N-terminal domain-containing protein [Tindallia magadiensis]